MAKRRFREIYLRRPKGCQTYQAVFWVHGRRYDRGTGERTKDDATRVAKEIRDSLDGEGPKSNTDFEWATVKWLESVSKVLGMYAEKHWSPRWKSLGEITSISVQKYISERLDQVSLVTLLKELSSLRMFLKWALSARLISSIPTWVPPRLETDYQPICLTPGQVKAILREMHGDARDYCAFEQAKELIDGRGKGKRTVDSKRASNKVRSKPEQS